GSADGSAVVAQLAMPADRSRVDHLAAHPSSGWMPTPRTPGARGGVPGERTFGITSGAEGSRCTERAFSPILRAQIYRWSGEGVRMVRRIARLRAAMAFLFRRTLGFS